MSEIPMWFAIIDGLRREALGFSFEGIFRQHWVYNGRNRDTAWYSMIDTEWAALRPAFDAWLAPANFDDDGMQRSRLPGAVRGGAKTPTGT